MSIGIFRWTGRHLLVQHGHIGRVPLHQAPTIAPRPARITPPLSVLQRIPQWRPTSQEASQDYKGVLRLIIDRSGAVESVSMPTGTRPAYDQTLMRAARDWKFQPAQRQGRPVKYLKVIEIHLAPVAPATN